jgi:hypothetical protein
MSEEVNRRIYDTMSEDVNRRIYDTMSEDVNRRIYDTMAKEQTIIYKILHRQLEIEQHPPL